MPLTQGDRSSLICCEGESSNRFPLTHGNRKENKTKK